MQPASSLDLVVVGLVEDSLLAMFNNIAITADFYSGS